MQGFWRRTKPWQPTAGPRERPVGEALEMTFKDNLQEVIHVNYVWKEEPSSSVGQGPCMEKEGNDRRATRISQQLNRIPYASPPKMRVKFLLNSTETVTKTPSAVELPEPDRSHPRSRPSHPDALDLATPSSKRRRPSIEEHVAT
jgi:hypothetical protein